MKILLLLPMAVINGYKTMHDVLKKREHKTESGVDVWQKLS